MRSEKTSFLVTRLLPDGGAGLQYRIKGERDGIERVVTESSIESAGENFSFSPPNSGPVGHFACSNHFAPHRREPETVLPVSAVDIGV
jgi:hypothetical protein